MGGKMWVASEPGKGSSFHFSVRFAYPEVEQQTLAPEIVGAVHNAAPSPSLG
jgi:hypothetical protein